MAVPNPAAVQKYLLAKSLSESGQLEPSVDLYRQAITLGLDDARIWFDLGFVYCQLQQHAQSLECWDEALRRGSDSAIAHNNRADSLLHLRRYDEALEAAQRAADMGSIEGLHTLAECYKAKGQTESAILALEKIVSSATSDYQGVRENAVEMISRLKQSIDVDSSGSSDPLQVYILNGTRKVQVGPRTANSVDPSLTEAENRRKARMTRLIELKKL